ncbi:MAG: hypothetical protein U0L26_14560 [Cellulosilyticum sp.]|nr:hypothetical protein [Cellulosilyticum sp.]MEE1073576.1 hypothetical protein [Cellulosilyticum sp.]
MLRMKGIRSSRTKDTSIIDFILGGLLVVIGLYSICKNTSVGIFWVSKLFGTNLPSGIITIPIIAAIVILILNHKSPIGWGVMGIGIILLLINIIFSVRIMFHTTSLLQYILMFGGTFAGFALLARALLR